LFTSDMLGLDDASHYIQAESRYAESLRCRTAGEDPEGTARDLFYLAWTVEKQGRGVEAVERAEEARRLFRDSESLGLYAECCHSIGVWRFHHFDEDPPVEDFRQAARTRLDIGNLMGAAQSWHNLGFVQLIAGRAADAASSYLQSIELLEKVRAGSDSELAASAFRQLGFVYSHQAYAAARYETPTEALRAATTYFSHVQQTGTHREPVYAYLAPGIALAGTPEDPPAEAEALDELVGIGPDADAWLRRAVREASDAMTSHVDTGTGRRAYLGAHLLALGHLAERCFTTGRSCEGDELLTHARDLARARGWLGEESRLIRFDGRGR
jgi:tetratricopeptide (TPR) repeat protein